jgi:hypothetical protein
MCCRQKRLTHKTILEPCKTERLAAALGDVLLGAVGRQSLRKSTLRGRVPRACGAAARCSWAMRGPMSYLRASEREFPQFMAGLRVYCATLLKTVVAAMSPRVQIPQPPPLYGP